MLPTEMNAIEIREPGEPEVLQLARRPVPTPGPGEVLIEVAAAGVNRPDVIQRRGHYAPPPGASDIPGLEVAGRVAATGSGVSGWRAGDAICALLAGGGYAEYCSAPVPQCLPIPAGLELADAAALPETVFTVWSNLMDGGRLAPGETLLVHGGTSGIGTTAIQVAHALGARVLATAGSAEKCRACEELGADRGIDYRNEDFLVVCRELTHGRGVDVVLDIVGGEYLSRNVECLAPGGRMVVIGLLRGAKGNLDLGAILRRRLTLTGSTLRPRSVEEKGAIARAVREHVWPMIEAKQVRPIVYQRFPLAEAAAAHRLMESNAHIGKILLSVR